MLFPPSLPAPVLSRAFRAGNGELGLQLADASAFLEACVADQVEVLGWELWVVDHALSTKNNTLGAAPGCWSGLIPMMDSPVLNVIHGDGSLAEVRAQLQEVQKDLNQIVPEWFPWVRINFTIA
jgi:hypothetical protein